MTQDDLIKAAATAAIGALTKSVAEPLIATGQQVWTWLKGKLTGANTATADEIAAAPAKSSAPRKLEALLLDAIDDDPARVAELTELLGGKAGVQSINQTAITTGNNNTTTQVAGNNNKITGTRT